LAGHIKARTTKGGEKRYVATLPGIPARTFTRKRDARAWLDDRRTALLRGELLHPEFAAITVRQLSEGWEATWPSRIEPSTQVRYKGRLDNYILPAFGRMPASSVTHQQVQQFIDQLVAGQLRRVPIASPGKQRTKAPASSTVRVIHATLSALFTEGVRAGVVRVNPALHVRLPKKQRRTAVILTRSEVNALAAALPEPFGLAAQVLAGTGLRVGELWALRRRDIDFMHNRIHVERALKCVRGHLMFGMPKSGKGRWVIFPASLKPLLEEHLASRPTGPDTLLFVNRRGNPMRHDGRFLATAWRRATRSALPPAKWGLVWHDLRHTHASILLGEGAPVIAVSKRLGHASVTTTLDVYGHLLADADAALAELFGRDDDDPPAALVRA
jgi:integrase